MADTSQAHAIRVVVDRLLATAGPFDLPSVTTACATELRPEPCPNLHMLQFVGYPATGPFETLTLRMPRPQAPATRHLVILRVRPDMVVRQDELRGYFALPRQGMTLESHVPPEGVRSFREEVGDTVLFLDLTVRSRILTTVVLHRHRPPGSRPNN